MCLLAVEKNRRRENAHDDRYETTNQEGKTVQAKYGEVMAVRTGKYTGRSPKDKWIVKNEGSETAENIDWGDVNQPTTPEVFDELYDRAVDYFNTRDTVYVFDGYCGASPQSRKKVRFVFEMAWQVHFGTYIGIWMCTYSFRDYCNFLLIFE